MRDQTQTSPSHQPVFSPIAATLAWLWPGLGHIAHGERKRGGLVMFGVLFLFFCGLLAGGFDAVDRRDDRLWFIAQAFCGPIAFGADIVNQNYVKQLPDEQRIRTIGLARVNEMGTLMIALAGLMNLVVVLDALHYHPRPQSAAEPPPRRRAED